MMVRPMTRAKLSGATLQSVIYGKTTEGLPVPAIVGFRHLQANILFSWMPMIAFFPIIFEQISEPSRNIRMQGLYVAIIDGLARKEPGTCTIAGLPLTIMQPCSAAIS